MKRRWRPLLLTTWFATAPGRALAEDAEDLRSLLSENIVTTASTTAQKASTAPATSVTITSEEMRLYGTRSLAEAIDFLSLGVMTSDPLRTPDIGSRGVLLPNDDGRHFLLLVNGHALNDPLYGAARFDQGVGIPMDLVDHIEVILGPGSVLYGSNAMMGVINVITKTTRQYRGGHVLGDLEPGRSWTAGAGAGFTLDLGRTDLQVTSGVEYYTRFGPTLQIEERTFPPSVGTGGLLRFRRGGDADGVWGGPLEHAYFTEAPSGMLSVRAGDLEMSVSAAVYRRGVPYSTVGTNVDYDDPESYEIDRSLRLDLKHATSVSTLVHLTSRLYADGFDYERRINRDALTGCFRSDIETCTYRDVGVARWAGLEERLSFNWFQDLSVRTMLGIDTRYRWVSTKQDAIDFDTGRPFAPTAGRLEDGAAQSVILSPYAEQVWSPASFIDLNAGARLDVDSRVTPVLSPRGALALSPSRDMTFRGIYSQAFRAPTWSETDLANYRVAPSDDVKPEIVRSVEGSVEQRFGTQRLIFGVFRSWWKNMIEAAPLSAADTADLQRRGILPITATNLVQFHNVASIDNYGWNGAWEGSLVEGRLSYGTNVTAAYTRREVGNTSSPLVVAPRIFGNARLAYSFGGHVPTPALVVRYVGNRLMDRPMPRDRSSVAPALAEFRFTLSGTVPALNGVGYRASATYATAASGSYGVGPGLLATGGDSSVTPIPIDQFRVLLALRYDFFTEDAAVGDIQ